MAVTMPKDTAIATADGLLQPAWLEYLGQLEKLAGTVGDLSDSIDDTINTATGWVGNRAYAESSSLQTLATQIPHDNTIPQISEGTEILSVSITPTSAAARLRAKACLQFGSTRAADVVLTAALFIGGSTDAAMADVLYLIGSTIAGNGGQMVMQYEWAAGTTAPTTVAVRAGPQSITAGNVNFNGGANGVTVFSTAPKSSLVVEQITVG